MIRQRDLSSLRPLIFAICMVYLLLTVGTLALTFTLNTHKQAQGGDFQCEMNQEGHAMTCGKIYASKIIQALVWIECLLLLPIIVLCMLTLWARATVERLPGNTACAIPCSLILVFLLQLIFLIVCCSKGYFRHHWKFFLALFVQMLFALPVAYLFFNLPQINGDSEPPFLRDDRQNLLKNASSRDKNVASSPISSKRAPPSQPPSQPSAKPPAPTSIVIEAPVSASGTGTGTGSREEEGGAGSITGSKEPIGQSAETIPMAPTSDPAVTATEGGASLKSAKTDDTGKSGKPAEVVPPVRELEDSESKKKAKKDAKSPGQRSKSQSQTKTASDRLKHTKIIIPPKSKTKSSRSGA